MSRAGADRDPLVGPSPPPAPAIPAPRAILVTRLLRIGDVILSLPVVDALRAAFPNAEIDYMAESTSALAVVGHPAIRNVFRLGLRSWPGLPAPPDVLFRLRGARYDWVIDLYGNPRSALLAGLTGAPVRVGPNRLGRRRLYTHVIPPVEEPFPAVDHHLLALQPLGLNPGQGTPRLYLSEEERAEGLARVNRVIPSGGPRVGLHVGNRWPAKRWPEERFQAILRLLSTIGARGLVLAGPGEEALARRVASGAGRDGRSDAPVLSGLPLRSYFATVAALDVLVTNDGSPLHVGPALGVPTVGILGPTVPEIWFPYSADQGHQLLCKSIWCRPCHRHDCARMDCMDWIGVPEALRAIERALAHAEGTRASA